MALPFRALPDSDVTEDPMLARSHALALTTLTLGVLLEARMSAELYERVL